MKPTEFFNVRRMQYDFVAFTGKTLIKTPCHYKIIPLAALCIEKCSKN